MKPLPHTHSCFVCGESNSRGFHLRSETDGKVVRAEVVFNLDHVGFKDTVHGGLTATILDEVLTWACVVGGRKFAYCAELNVRYLLPIKPQVLLVAEAEMVANKRGRLFEAKGLLREKTGRVLASATGKYLPLKEGEAAMMGTDFLGDISWLFEPPMGTEGAPG